jgi:hypothetical protein
MTRTLRGIALAISLIGVLVLATGAVSPCLADDGGGASTGAGTSH